MKILLSVLAILAIASQAQARNKVAPKLSISSRSYMYTQKTGVGGRTGNTMDILTPAPASPSCIAQIDPPELINGLTVSEDWGTDSVLTIRPRAFSNIGGDTKSCRFKLLYSFKDGTYMYSYRELTSELNLDVSRRISFGPDVGLGVFGEVLSVLTVGISDIIPDSINSIKHSLQSGLSSALSKRVPVQNIVTDMTLLLCEVEAAKLTKRACASISRLQIHTFC